MTWCVRAFLDSVNGNTGVQGRQLAVRFRLEEFPHSEMDLTLASEARIAGSIPAEGVVFRVTVVVSSLARGVPHMRLQVRILSGTFFAYAN